MAQKPDPSLLEQLTMVPDQASPDTPAPAADSGGLWLNVLAGSITGVISLVKAISYAALIFSADLSLYLPAGLGILLVSNLVIRLVTVVTTSFPPAIYNPQSEQVVIVAFMAAAVSDQLFIDPPPEIMLATIVACISLSSVLTGLTLYLLGVFRQGDLGRYLPYPITGGFLAGISWLLIAGAFKLIVGHALTIDQITTILGSSQGLQLVAGVAFAGTLGMLTHRVKQAWVMPVSFLAAVGGFYGVVAMVGLTIADVQAGGWLLEISTQGDLWQPVSLELLSNVNWSLLQGQWGPICTLILLSTLSLLLTATNLELSLDREINLNQELKSLGTANIVSGLCGGTVGALSLSSNLLAYKIGGRNQWVGLSGAVVYGVVLWFGTVTISYLPRFVLGGLLLYLGLELLTKWLYTSWLKLPKDEYLIALFVFGAIVFTDLITGVSIGLLLATGLFVVNYSRLSPCRHDVLGGSYRSNVIRPINQGHFLNRQGNQIYILELEGYIFFGTANTLLNQVKQTIEQHRETLPIRFVIVDFRLVKGIDFSATLSFDKLKSLAHKNEISLLLTHLPSKLAQTFRRTSLLAIDDDTVGVFDDLDRGFEWCEEALLGAAQWRRQRFFPLAIQLNDLLATDDDVSEFMAYLETLELASGDSIVEQGDIENGLYFVEFGQVSSIIHLPNNLTRRLRTYTAGTICGEIGLSPSKQRSSSLQADQNSRVYLLSSEAFEQMQGQAPHLANALLTFIVRSQSEHIESYEQQLNSLLR